MKKQWRRRQETGKMQKAAYCNVKGRLSDAKRLSFTMQKTTFCNALNIKGLHARTQPCCKKGAMPAAFRQKQGDLFCFTRQKT